MLLIRKMAFVGRITQFYCQFHLNSRFSQVQYVCALVSCRNLSIQGDQVTTVKAENASDTPDTTQLKARKEIAEDKELELTPHANTIDRNKMNDLLREKFFYVRSFSIYGGITGQFDFGPMGCALKSNILTVWRSFFILEEQMLEVECPILTPKSVLMTSGYVDKFTDLIVKDVKTGECFRLDHLIRISLNKLVCDKNTPQNVREECENICMKLDGKTKAQKSWILRKYDIKSPVTGNDLTEPVDYYLMLETQMGPSAVVKGFLRPDTAQGIFVNFKRLLLFNNGKLPFAAAQIGNVFRNGVPPREFTLAEIVHFCDPDDKSHSKFHDVANTPMFLYSACNQMDGKSPEQMTIGEAVRLGIVSSETLGYFMAKVQLFLLKIGLNPHGVRFRQNMSNEMPHNTCDCWDAECLTSYGWIECVGCADRSVYDLTQHSKATGVSLVAERRLPKPKTVIVNEIVPNKDLIADIFKINGPAVKNALNLLSSEEVSAVEKQLKEKGSCDLIINFRVYNLTKEMIGIKSYEKEVEMEEFTPSVIETSFGIGRIMYALFEHSFKMRANSEKKSYLALPALIAPIKCSVISLGNLAALNPKCSVFIKQLSTELTKLEIRHKIDCTSLTAGKKFAKTDKIAVPFGVTIDSDTLQAPHIATLRERDSMNQVRVPLDEIPGVVSDLSRGKMSWSQVEAKYPKFEQQESSKSQTTVSENALTT